MQKIKYKTSISLLIVLASILLVLLCLLIVHTFRTGEEATVGIFSLAATLVGTIFIAIELKNGVGGHVQRDADQPQQLFPRQRPPDEGL